MAGYVLSYVLKKMDCDKIVLAATAVNPKSDRKLEVSINNLGEYFKIIFHLKDYCF
jgi:hypothetical protein